MAIGWVIDLASAEAYFEDERLETAAWDALLPPPAPAGRGRAEGAPGAGRDKIRRRRRGLRSRLARQDPGPAVRRFASGQVQDRRPTAYSERRARRGRGRGREGPRLLMPGEKLTAGEARIVGLYAAAKKRILGELTRMAISSYNESMAQETRKKVDTIVSALNAAVVREGARAVRSAYRGQAAATAVRAEVLGFEEARTGSAGLSESLARLRRYLLEANATIRRSVDNFLAALRIAAGAVSRIQEFDDVERDLYIAEVGEAAAVAVASSWSRRRRQR